MPTSSDTGLCVWIIEGKLESRLELDFSVLDLPGNCNDAYVMIRDGESSDSPVLGKYCGWMSTPIRIAPRGSKVWVEYKTSVKSNGMFVLNWSQTNGRGTYVSGAALGISSFHDIFRGYGYLLSAAWLLGQEEF